MCYFIHDSARFCTIPFFCLSSSCPGVAHTFNYIYIRLAQNLATFPCLDTHCHCPMQPSSIHSSSMVRPLVICSAPFPLRFWRSRQCRVCWHIIGHYEDMAESFTFSLFMLMQMSHSCCLVSGVGDGFRPIHVQ